MSSKRKVVELQAAPAQPTSEETRAVDLFNKQKAYFASDATKSYEWRVDQLNRLTRMLKDNFERFADAARRDFKTASQENVFEVSASIATSEYAKSQLKEWMKPVEAPLPKFLAASGHKGMVCREPYGVTLIICPFNGPLVLWLRPAIAALSAGNPCILKLSEALLATDELLLELIPRYFEPEALSAVVGGREVVTKLLTLLSHKPIAPFVASDAATHGDDLIVSVSRSSDCTRSECRPTVRSSPELLFSADRRRRVLMVKVELFPGALRSRPLGYGRSRRASP